MPEAQAEGRTHLQQNAGGSIFNNDRTYNAICALLLVLSITTWFLPIRAGLSTDETGTYWQISQGFSQIWPRGLISLCFPAYTYLLWLVTRVLGTSEIALRTPSVLAMLGAVCLLYLAARELFDRATAILTAILFCLHPILRYAAIDVRPYAFGILAANAAIFILLRLRNNDSNRMAALFGLLAVSVVYFHYLFAVILPALAVCFFLIKTDRKVAWRQFGIATAVIVVCFLPLIPGIAYLFHTRASHVYEQVPTLDAVFRTCMPWLPLFIAVGLTALLLLYAGYTFARKPEGPQDQLQRQMDVQTLLLCASLALIPLMILFSVSRWTSTRIFTERHRLITIPGIALCWGLLFVRLRSRALPLLFSMTVIAVTAAQMLASPDLGRNRPSFKYALEAIEKSASTDNVPVIFCSSFTESDYEPMPVADAVKDSSIFAPLSYYKLSVPVIPLPMSLNAETIRLGSEFLMQATEKQQRFLAVGEPNSYKSLDWLAQNASGAFDVRTIGIFKGVKALEFIPKAQADTPAGRSVE